MTQKKSREERQVFGPCTDCGARSQKNGECWDFGKCAKCYNRKWKKAMTCSGCGITSNHTDRQCWKDFGMCIKCAVKNHPDKIQKNQVTRYGKEHGIVAPRPPRYEMCPECKVTTMVKLRTSRNGNNIGLPAFYCVPCRIILVKDSKLRIILPMEVKQND